MFRRPERVNGMPVVLDIERLTLVTPIALLNEKVSPGPNFILPPDMPVRSYCIRVTYQVQYSQAPATHTQTRGAEKPPLRVSVAALKRTET